MASANGGFSLLQICDWRIIVEPVFFFEIRRRFFANIVRGASDKRWFSVSHANFYSWSAWKRLFFNLTRLMNASYVNNRPCRTLRMLNVRVSYCISSMRWGRRFIYYTHTVIVASTESGNRPLKKDIFEIFRKCWGDNNVLPCTRASLSYYYLWLILEPLPLHNQDFVKNVDNRWGDKYKMGKRAVPS